VLKPLWLRTRALRLKVGEVLGRPLSPILLSKLRMEMELRASCSFLFFFLKLFPPRTFHVFRQTAKRSGSVKKKIFLSRKEVAEDGKSLKM
jgi:hypothetical protein